VHIIECRNIISRLLSTDYNIGTLVLMSTQTTIDLVGGSVFSLAALVFGGLFFANTYMDSCPQNKVPGLRLKLLASAVVISYIQAFAYWASFGGYGSFTRPGDGLVVQWALILTWPFSWFYLAKALAAYLLHKDIYAKAAAHALALSGLAHYLGAYIDTTTPGIQTAAYVIGTMLTLSTVYIAVVLRRRRDTLATVALVVGVIGLALGFCLSYLLAEYFLNIVTGTGFSVWLLVANVVVYIVYIVFLLLTAKEPPKGARME